MTPIAPPLTTADVIETVNDMLVRGKMKPIASGDVPPAEWIARQVAEIRASGAAKAETDSLFH